MPHYVLFFVLFLMTVSVNAFELKSGQTVTVSCDTAQAEPVVKSALRMLTGDMAKVLSAKVRIGEGGSIIVRKMGLKADGRKEAFRLSVSGGKFYVAGSDAHGVAYGLLEVSRLLGVSPWKK